MTRGFCGSVGVNKHAKRKLTVHTRLGSGTTTLQALERSFARVQRAERAPAVTVPAGPHGGRAASPAGRTGLTQAGGASLEKAQDVLPGPDRKARPQPKRHSSQQTLQER